MAYKNTISDIHIAYIILLHSQFPSSQITCTLQSANNTKGDDPMALSSQANRKLSKKIGKIAKDVIKTEIEALVALKNSLGKSFEELINLIQASKGKIILSGIGKSGIIAQKISSTLTSTKTQAIFIHPVEAMHGDMALVSSEDTVILLSNSGETIEITKFASLCKKRNSKIVAITNNPYSKLASLSDIVIDIKTPREACPHNIIPTASAVSMLALGDAIAMTLMEIKGYDKNDFVQNHPGGNIGKLLYIKVSQIMRTGKKNPVVDINATVKEAIDAMTSSSLGAVSVIDSRKKLCGYFSDGDLRRKFSKISLKDPISKHMTENPVSIIEDSMAIEAAKIMNIKKIDNLPVVDRKNRVVGILDERDLIKEGII